MWWFQLLQSGFALIVIGLVAERLHALSWRDALGDEAFKRLLRAVNDDDRALLTGFAQARPACAWSGIFGAAEDAREGLADVRELAVRRLRLIRVCATLASTLGLLGGILILAGVSTPDLGLLALQAGALERERMTIAITTMAIGVGTSALIFQSLAVLRRAGQRQLRQAEQLARALEIA